jgi:arginine/serine-rich splicing factor 1/9
MKTAGEITYTDVYHDGTGVVEFEKLDDMKWALKTLDDTKLRTRAVSARFVVRKPSMSGLV